MRLNHIGSLQSDWSPSPADQTSVFAILQTFSLTKRFRDRNPIKDYYYYYYRYYHHCASFILPPAARATNVYKNFMGRNGIWVHLAVIKRQRCKELQVEAVNPRSQSRRLLSRGDRRFRG